jgi:rhamnosyltransferase
MTEIPIVAVVPAFHPDARVAHLVAALLSQVDRVVVVADGPDALPTPRRVEVETAGATVLVHDENRGIAAALNSGIRAAPDAGAVLTVDQDSTVPDGFVDALRAAWTRATAVGLKVGLVAPERVAGIPSQIAARRRGVALGRDPVQSGLLVTAEALSTVGEFDERLFIDGVDADYALRCLDSGFVVAVAEGLDLGHRLGDPHTVQIAGRRLELTRSKPFRYYYLARNRRVLVRRHVRRHPRWAAAQALGLVRHLAVTLTLAPDRQARALETWHGWRDVGRGVTGRRPEGGNPPS